jgi:hypothetical protein
VGETGAAQGTLVATLSGEAAAELRRELWSVAPGERELRAAKTLVNVPDPELKTRSLHSPVATDSEVVCQLDASWSGACLASGPITQVLFDRLIPWRTHCELGEARRENAIDLHFVRNEEIELDVALPASMQVEALPSTQSFQNDLGRFSIEWSRTAAGARVRRTLVLSRAVIPSKDYGAARQFFGALEQADHCVLLLRKHS